MNRSENLALSSYKEMWVYSSCRIALNLASVAIPARVSGTTSAGAEFRELRTGKLTRVSSGNFACNLAAGEYTVSYGRNSKRMHLVNGVNYHLELNPARALKLELHASALPGGVKVTAQLEGSGAHELDLRTFNLSTQSPSTKVDLASDGKRTMEWMLKIVDQNKPWVLVAIPDQKIEERQELFGTTLPLPERLSVKTPEPKDRAM